LRNGAGLLVVNSTVTIRDCMIDANVSARSGGGLYAWNADVTIESTLVEGNEAGQTGGGCAFFDTQASLFDVILAMNTTVSNNKGGGGMIFSGFEADCVLTLNQCALLGNASTFSGEVDGTPYDGTGGGLYSNNASEAVHTVTINLSDSTFTGNTSAGTGGAIWMGGEITCSIAGSLICENSPEQIVGGYEDVESNCITDDCGENCDCVGDLDANGVVDGADLGTLLSMWGPCPEGSACLADLTGDGQVNGADLAALLAAWGVCS
jgi:predicted outer membrane repeat protein